MAGPERFRRFYTKMVCLDNQINYDILYGGVSSKNVLLRHHVD